MDKWDCDAVKSLRGAVYRAEVLRGRLTRDVPQLAGDGLLAAVAQDIEGAAELAAECASMLRERWWFGDQELADQLR